MARGTAVELMAIMGGVQMKYLIQMILILLYDYEQYDN